MKILEFLADDPEVRISVRADKIAYVMDDSYGDDKCTITLVDGYAYTVQHAYKDVLILWRNAISESR